jgi:hypothetical protein
MYYNNAKQRVSNLYSDIPFMISSLFKQDSVRSHLAVIYDPIFNIDGIIHSHFAEPIPCLAPNLTNLLVSTDSFQFPLSSHIAIHNQRYPIQALPLAAGPPRTEKILLSHQTESKLR